MRERMKIVVVSDSHGNVDVLRDIALREGDADIFLHCGDSQVNEAYISPFVSVKGNCDYFMDYPPFRIVDTPYGKIYVEHGNRLFPMGVGTLKELGCSIYLQGHTHIKKLIKEEDIYFANPGSITKPRDGDLGSYLVIHLTKDKVDFIFKTLD